MPTTNQTTPDFPPGYAEENNGNMLTIPCAVFIAVSPFIVGIRMWARICRVGTLHADDWVLLVALALLLLTDALSINIVRLGMGHHLTVLQLDPEKYTRMKMRFWLSQIVYKACLQTTKLSLLILYKRIFDSVLWFKRLMQCSIVFIAMYIIEAVLVSIFECNPIPAIWDSSIKGPCISTGPFFLFNAYFATISDVLVLLFPIPLLVGLKIPISQKLALIPVFGIGLVVVVVSALRLATFYLPKSIDSSSFDLTGQMWTILEVNLAVICAALPAVRTLLARMHPKTFGTYHSDAGASGFDSKKWNSGWSKVDDRNAINLTNIKYGGTSSEALNPELSGQPSEGIHTRP